MGGNGMKPIQIYEMYIDGSPYGKGNLDYMRELLIDYAITCKRYGKEEVSIQVKKVKQEEAQ
jgi:hypothetical protein